MRSEAMDWLGNRYRDGQSGIHEKHPNLGAGECCLPPHRVIGVSEESWEATARGSSDRPESRVAAGVDSICLIGSTKRRSHQASLSPKGRGDSIGRTIPDRPWASSPSWR